MSHQPSVILCRAVAFANASASRSSSPTRRRPRRCCAWWFFWTAAAAANDCQWRSTSSAFAFGGGMLFGSSNRRLEKSPSSLQLELLDRAAQVRQKVGPHPPYFVDNNNPAQWKQELFLPSSFQMANANNNNYVNKETTASERGFCNWLIPGRLMVGQYPSQTPEVNGPCEDEAVRHLQTITVEDKACIRLFCSLQSELPAQDDWETWNRNKGMIFLEPDSVRRRFPRPFTHYAPVVQELLVGKNERNISVIFLHSPIEDLNVPESQEPLQTLMLQLLIFLSDNDNSAIYLHCWGGRGRAGLVGACLISLIWPQLDADTILQWIQTGYESRLGHDQMPPVLQQSPQTSSQRAFVRQFVQDFQRLYHQQQQQQ